MRRLHILLANVFFRPLSYGGATVVAEAMAQAMAQRGHRISVIAARPAEPGRPYAVTRATPFAGVDLWLIGLPRGRPAPLVEENPYVDRALAPLIDRLAPDVAHLHCLQELGAGLLPLLKARGIPTLLSFHDHWWTCARQFPFRPEGRACDAPGASAAICTPCAGPAAAARLDRLAALARLADLRTAPSRDAAAFAQAGGTGPVTLWENGISPPSPDFAARRAARTGPVVFGFLGGPSALKGWPLLKAAWTHARPAGAELRLVDGGLFGSWWPESLRAQLPPGTTVVPRFAPAAADDFYSGIDVLLFPSQWRETFGLTVREALARGLRVIRTEGGGQAEHPDHPGVRTIPFGTDPAPLAAAIRAVAEDIADGAPRTLTPAPVRTVEEQAEALERMLQGLAVPGRRAA